MKARRPYFESELPRPMSLGRIMVSPPARWELTRYDVELALFRHANHDWGNLGWRWSRANDKAVREGTVVYSEYRSRRGVKFGVTTTADRTETLVFLPKEV